jgi:hypothetical protein
VFKAIFRISKVDVEELLVCMQTRCPDLKDYNYESKLLYASWNIKKQSAEFANIFPEIFNGVILAIDRWLGYENKTAIRE